MIMSASASWVWRVNPVKSTSMSVSQSPVSMADVWIRLGIMSATVILALLAETVLRSDKVEELRPLYEITSYLHQTFFASLHTDI